MHLLGKVIDKERKIKGKRIAYGILFMMIASAGSLLFGAPKKNAALEIPTVEQVDFARFEGKWFEISRIPIPVARDWVNTCDIYIPNKDGTWSVRYEGNKGSATGPRKVLKQKLRIPDPEKPGQMEVSFIPFVWLKYRLIYVSDDYRFMLVGSSSMDFFWVMSKEAIPSTADYAKLLEKAVGFGYDINRLERVSQSGQDR